MRYLLDTNIVSELIRPAPDPLVVQQYEDHAPGCVLASVVWHELTYGVARLPPGQRRTRLTQYLTEVIYAALPIVAYDAQAAAWHAHQRSRLERLGQPQPFADGMLAAVAATRGLTLVTRNTSDFVGYEGLLIEDWFAS